MTLASCRFSKSEMISGSMYSLQMKRLSLLLAAWSESALRSAKISATMRCMGNLYAVGRRLSVASCRMVKSTRNELPRCGKVATKVRGRCSMGTTMKHRIVTGALVLAFGLSAMASTRQNPFDVIVARNVFGLRPIPEAKSSEPESPPAPLLPEIRLTGITTLLGKPIVTLHYEDKQAKKTEFPPLLAEGESYRDLKVEHIDLEAQTVAVRVGQ